MDELLETSEQHEDARITEPAQRERQPQIRVTQHTYDQLVSCRLLLEEKIRECPNAFPELVGKRLTFSHVVDMLLKAVDK